MTVFSLKIIAVASMLIDHFGAILLVGQGDLYTLSRLVGRVAFPIFAYLIANGCRHTSDKAKYMLRLGILAVISEIPFDLAFMSRIDFFLNTNVFYTLFLGATATAVYDLISIRSKALGVLAGLLMLVPAWAVNSDYAHLGVLIIFALYLADPQSRINRTIALAAGMFALYGPAPRFAASMAAVLLVFFYNNALGPRHAAFKWGFYLFYPIHITVLFLLVYF